MNEIAAQNAADNLMFVNDKTLQSLGLDVKVGYTNPVDQPAEPGAVLSGV